MATLLTPWLLEAQKVKAEAARKSYGYWNSDTADLLLPKVADVGALTEAEQLEVIRDLKNGLGLSAKPYKKWSRHGEKLQNWLKKLGDELTGRLDGEFMSTTLKALIELEALGGEHYAFSIYSDEGAVKENWAAKVKWQEVIEKGQVPLEEIVGMMPKMYFPKVLSVLPEDKQEEVLRILEDNPMRFFEVVELLGYTGGYSGTKTQSKKLEPKAHKIIEEACEEIVVSATSTVREEFFGYFISRYVEDREQGRKYLEPKWHLSDEGKIALLQKSKKAKGHKAAEHLGFLVAAGNLTVGETKALLKHPLFKTKDFYNYGEMRRIWQRLLSHPSLTIEDVKENLPLLRQTKGQINFQQVNFVAGKWPQLLNSKFWQTSLSEQGHWTFDWSRYLRKDTLANPEAAKAVVGNLLENKRGIRDLFSRMAHTPELATLIPWDIVLAHPRLKRSTLRFRLQAMAARQTGRTVEGLDPMSSIRDRIKRTRSGHSATLLLIELAKNKGMLFQYLEGELVLRLFKLAGIVAKGWHHGQWSRMGELRNIKLAGETGALLMPAAMRVYFSPHLDLTNGGLDSLADDPEGWFMPPLTPSTGLPKILKGMEPAARFELVKSLRGVGYVTEKNMMGEKEVAAALEALRPEEGATVKQVKAPEPDKVKNGAGDEVRDSEALGKEVNVFGQNKLVVKDMVEKWLKVHLKEPENERRSDEDKKAKKDFQEFMVNNPAWFELAKQYPPIILAMEDVYPLLEHVKLINEEEGGISRGIRAKEAVGTIMAAWKILDNKDPKIKIIRAFFPGDILTRTKEPREDWNKLGENQVSSGFMAWLATAPLANIEKNHLNRGWRQSEVSQKLVLANVLKLGEELTPDLVRKLQSQGEHELFQMITATLGKEAGLAVLRNPNFTLKRMAGQQARPYTNDPKALRQLAQAIEEETARKGLSYSYDEEYDGDGEGVHISSKQLKYRVLEEELSQMKDAYTANPEQFKEAESFSRWIELTDEFHRRLRDLDRHKEVKQAWKTYKTFPKYSVEGYRSRELLILPLRDNIALALEGVLRKHCVGSYSNSCLRQETAIYNVKDARGEPIGTLEIDLDDKEIRQFRGFMNRSIAPEIVEQVKEVMNRLGTDGEQAALVKEAYQKVSKAMSKEAVAKTLQVGDLVKAWVECGLLANKTPAQIMEGLAGIGEPEEIEEAKKSLVARGADFVRTETEANELGQFKVASWPEEKVRGIGVDPLRLLIAKLEDQLKEGKGLKEVLDSLMKHLPEEGPELYGHFYNLAVELAKTPAQTEAIEAVVALSPELPTEATNATKRKRWLGLSAAREERGGKGQSLEIMSNYILEMIPTVREAAIRAALGESEEREAPKPKNRAKGQKVAR